MGFSTVGGIEIVIVMVMMMMMMMAMIMTMVMMMMMMMMMSILLCQYLEMMEQFKELHKTVEQLRTSGLSTGEIKKVSLEHIANYFLDT